VSLPAQRFSALTEIGHISRPAGAATLENQPAMPCEWHLKLMEDVTNRTRT